MAYSRLNELENVVPHIIEKGFNDFDQVKSIEAFGKYLARGIRDSNNRSKNVRGITTSKIRAVYTEFMKLKIRGSISQQDLLMITPRLAYMAARGNSESYRDLQVVLSKGIKTVSEIPESNRFNAFCNLTSFFEAILAYHKYYGGKE